MEDCHILDLRESLENDGRVWLGSHWSQEGVEEEGRIGHPSLGESWGSRACCKETVGIGVADCY